MFASVRRRQPGSSAIELNLAPLLDMVFILLIFFLVTATFVQDAGIRVERPRATHAQSLGANSLRIAIGASGGIYVEGKRVELEGVRTRVRRFLARERRGTVVLVPDERVPSRQLVEVLDAAKAAGAQAVAIAVDTRGPGQGTR